jgi:NAD(P)-dependent dehydrogenase (short-subunit alcohol dehydrogenase family)
LLVRYAITPASQSIADQFSTKNLLRTFETNVFAPYWLIRAAAPIMPRGGSVIFTASGIVSDPQQFLVDYGASKGAVTYMVRGLAQSLLPNGIRVNGVAPGAVYTPIWPGSGAGAELVDQFLGMVPYKRLAQPAELAPLYVSLAEPNQTHTNGEIYSCTGSGPGL